MQNLRPIGELNSAVQLQSDAWWIKALTSNLISLYNITICNQLLEELLEELLTSSESE